MDKHCKDSKELAKAIKNGEDSIIVEGDLKNKVIRIKLTGKLAWSVCAVSLGEAIMFYMATPEATVASAPAGGVGGVIIYGWYGSNNSGSCYIRLGSYSGCYHWCGSWWDGSIKYIKR